MLSSVIRKQDTKAKTLIKFAQKLLAGSVRTLQADRRASIAVSFALAFPALAVAVSISLEYVEINRTKAKLQSIVDAAALSGANELGYGNFSAVTQRAENFAEGQAGSVAANWTVSTKAAADPDAPSVTVVQQATRQSMFGNLLAPSAFHVTVTATAMPNSRTPLCVLGSDTHGDVVSLQNTSTVTATGCLIQSNADMKADDSARITAGAVRVAGAARGMIYPSAVVDAPTITDPFSSLPIDVPAACNHQDLQLDSGMTYLNPGVHCGNVHLKGYAQLVLNPGEHYFTKGNFDVQDSAQITGTDVVLIFKGQYDMKFKGSAGLWLEGRKSGIYAGFALITDRSFKGNFKINTDNARSLHGTIYLPNATLHVSGADNKVADRSPWTVVIAKQIKVEGSAKLVINTDYNGSSIPVPRGVGPNSGTHLTN